MQDINYYVKTMYPYWEIHTLEGINNSNFIATYEQLKNSPLDVLSRVVEFIGLEHNMDIMSMAIEWSSINVMKQISSNVDEKGMGSETTFTGNFFRKRLMNDYESELNNKTILDIRRLVSRNPILVKHFHI